MARLSAARGGVVGSGSLSHSPNGAWSEDLQVAGEGQRALGCDSLEVMSLAAATNEMFHLYEAHNEGNLLSAGTFGCWLDTIEAAWGSGIDRITFTTSGSTGPPKSCTHRLSYLQTEILYLAEKFATRKRIVALAPAHHIYGFIFTAMLADQLGLEVMRADDIYASALACGLRQGDLIVSIPDYWQWLNQTVPKWPGSVSGVVSTAPCPPELIRALIERGLSEMIEVYGSSETSGIAVRSWPDRGYRLMPHWKPEDYQASDSASLIHISGIHVQLMDRISFLENGTFLLGGRQDGAVQVGGTNVYPARIAALLLARPGVAKAAVRLMKPEEGVRLKAFIVPESQVCTKDLHGELEKWIDTHLFAVERPKALTFGNTLPMNPFGKDADW